MDERCTHLGSRLELLERTKDSIGRTSHYMLHGARVGGAAALVEVVAVRLEREADLGRRIDFFYLLDSVVQCSMRPGRAKAADLRELDPMLAGEEDGPQTGPTSAAGRCFPPAVGKLLERLVRAIAANSEEGAAKVRHLTWRAPPLPALPPPPALPDCASRQAVLNIFMYCVAYLI